MGGIRRSFRILLDYLVNLAWMGGCSSGEESCANLAQHRVTAERISEITGLREQRMSGPVIARQLGMPVSTVGAILRPARPRHPTARRSESAYTGELGHERSTTIEQRSDDLRQRVLQPVGSKGQDLALTGSAGHRPAGPLTGVMRPFSQPAHHVRRLGSERHEGPRPDPVACRGCAKVLAGWQQD
jgi:hypothetical protein